MNSLLLNKYQPNTLDDFYQEDSKLIHFIKKLINTNELKIIIIGNIGTGKTTLLNNILFKYYDVDNIFEVKNNVLYINNLKEQGISFYKNEVKMFCKSICEVKNKRKTIILDDIDLLSDQNQQIFKIHMDNYINNVNFICSCNNLNKINLGILSHLINIKLKNIDSNHLNHVLENICFNEKIYLDQALKSSILIYSNNSIKLLINNLEKYKILKEGEKDFNVKMINNNLLINYLKDYYELCIFKKKDEAFNILTTVFNDGYSIIDIIDYMYTYLKNNNTINLEKKHLVIQILSKYTININNSFEDLLILYFLTIDIILIV